MLDNTRKLLLAFVTLILGVVFVVVIATNALAVTAKTPIYNESHNLASCVVYNASKLGEWGINVSDSDCNVTLTNYPTGWKTEDCPLTSVAINNGTGTALTSGTDYNVDTSTGIYQMLNTTATMNLTGNNTYGFYTYCQDNYLNIGWGRSVTNLVGGFFAIALLLISVGLFYDVARDTGLIRT